MPKFLKKILLFLSFSSLLYFISYFSYAFYHPILPNPSFQYLSALVDKFDQKIQELNLNLPKHKPKQNDPTDIDSALLHKEDLTTNSAEHKINLDFSPEYQNTYFFYLLRILFRFLFLVFVQLYVFYILLFRYGELFKDLCDLSFKSVKDFNWRSPINFIKSFYSFSTWLTSVFLYYNSLLSVRFRLLCYSIIVFLISILSFRAGIGAKRFLNTSPIIVGFTVYLSLLLTFNSGVNSFLTFLDTWFLPLWILSIFLRTFRVVTVDGSTFLELTTRDFKLSHEASCSLDLYLVFVIINFFKSLPILGRLFVLNPYLAHIFLFFTMCMAIHCFTVYIAKVNSVSSTPLSGVRKFVLFSLNSLVFYLFGVPNFFSRSPRYRMNSILYKNYARFKQLLNLLFGKVLEPLNDRPKFMFVMNFLKSIPQLIFLLLPPIFSIVYFEYSTLFVPISYFLTQQNNFKQKIYCMALFTLSDIARNVCHLLSWFSFKTALRITLVYFLNHALSKLGRVIKLER